MHRKRWIHIMCSDQKKRAFLTSKLKRIQENTYECAHCGEQIYYTKGSLRNHICDRGR